MERKCKPSGKGRERAASNHHCDEKWWLQRENARRKICAVQSLVFISFSHLEIFFWMVEELMLGKVADAQNDCDSAQFIILCFAVCINCLAAIKWDDDAIYMHVIKADDRAWIELIWRDDNCFVYIRFFGFKKLCN